MSYFYLSSILYFSEASIKVIFKELFLLFQLFSYISFVLKNHPEKKTYITYVLVIILSTFCSYFFCLWKTKGICHSKPDFKWYCMLLECRRCCILLQLPSLCYVNKKYQRCFNSITCKGLRIPRWPKAKPLPCLGSPQSSNRCRAASSQERNCNVLNACHKA